MMVRLTSKDPVLPIVRPHQICYSLYQRTPCHTLILQRAPTSPRKNHTKVGTNIAPVTDHG